MSRVSIHSLVAMFLLIVLCSDRAPADNVVGPVLINTDTPTDFEAVGALTTVDTDNPPDGVSLPLAVWLDVRGANWVFAIRHVQAVAAQPYDPPRGAGNPGGFNQINIEVKGGGLPPPAPVNQFGHITNPGPHAGETENNLPVATDQNARDVKFGAPPVRLAAMNDIEHPPNRHFDFYMLATRVGSLAGPAPVAPAVLPGPNNLLTGAFQLRAAHRERKPFSFPRDGAISSTPEAGSTIAFDAETGTLKFSIGWINGLTLNAGEFGVVERRFARDNMLFAKWVATPIELQYKGEDGYVFGKGSLSIADQTGDLQLAARFGEFLVADSSAREPLRSFAVLSHLSTVQNGAAVERTFLDEFIARNLFAESVPAERWSHWNGIDFAVVTDVDLLTLTNGFTKSVHEVPATYVLVANFDEDVERLEEF